MNKDFDRVIFFKHGEGKYSAHVPTEEGKHCFVSYHVKPSKEAAMEVLDDAEKMGIIPTKTQKPDFQSGQKLNWRPGTEKPPSRPYHEKNSTSVMVCTHYDEFFSAYYNYFLKRWERGIEGDHKYYENEIKCWITFEDLAKTLPQP